MRLNILRIGIALCATGLPALSEGFTFTIGSPVASGDFKSKTAAFVFRTDGCAEPAKAEVSGSAEGLVNGGRQLVPLRIMPLATPGVYAVFQTWPAGGEWVVNLKGNCSGATAGAVIPIGPRGFVRESSKFFPRPATAAEVDASLRALAPGGNK